MPGVCMNDNCTDRDCRAQKVALAAMVLDQSDYDELTQELNRHHRDFARISEICRGWRLGDTDPDFALSQIQNIVG